MKQKGIDVSAYQGAVNWRQVKENGVAFAILKIIRKDLKADRQFEANWSGCVDAGVPVQGVYNYSYAVTPEKAEHDAKQVINILGGRRPVVWLDVEDKCQSGLGYDLVRIIKAYEEVIVSEGHKFGVYTGLSFYRNYIRPYADEMTCPFWIARYPVNTVMTITMEPDEKKRPLIQHHLWGWQYSCKGNLPGISGEVDFNEAYMFEPAEQNGIEALLHRPGEAICVSSYYQSSMDPYEKAIIKNASGVILKVKEGAKNPYCFGKNQIATGWCNDGDIRSAKPPGDAQIKPNEENCYIVRAGDTLSGIAITYKTTVRKLQQKNGIADADKIRVGQKIII